MGQLVRHISALFFFGLPQIAFSAPEMPVIKFEEIGSGIKETRAKVHLVRTSQIFGSELHPDDRERLSEWLEPASRVLGDEKTRFSSDIFFDPPDGLESGESTLAERLAAYARSQEIEPMPGLETLDDETAIEVLAHWKTNAGVANKTNPYLFLKSPPADESGNRFVTDLEGTHFEQLIDKMHEHQRRAYDLDVLLSLNLDDISGHEAERIGPHLFSFASHPEELSPATVNRLHGKLVSDPLPPLGDFDIRFVLTELEHISRKFLSDEHAQLWDKLADEDRVAAIDKILMLDASARVRFFPHYVRWRALEGGRLYFSRLLKWIEAFETSDAKKGIVDEHHLGEASIRRVYYDHVKTKIFSTEKPGREKAYLFGDIVIIDDVDPDSVPTQQFKRLPRPPADLIKAGLRPLAEEGVDGMTEPNQREFIRFLEYPGLKEHLRRYGGGFVVRAAEEYADRLKKEKQSIRQVTRSRIKSLFDRASNSHAAEVFLASDHFSRNALIASGAITATAIGVAIWNYWTKKELESVPDPDEKKPESDPNSKKEEDWFISLQIDNYDVEPNSKSIDIAIE